MRQTPLRRIALAGLMAVLAALLLVGPSADAQGDIDFDEIIDSLESRGYYIEPWADGDSGSFAELVRYAEGVDDEWYFVSLAATVDPDFADQLRDAVSPRGNVVVLFIEDEEYYVTQLSSAYDESTENAALSSFDGDWATPDEFMRDVVRDLDRATAGDSSGPSSIPDSAGSSRGWWWLAVPVVLGGTVIWFASRSNKKKQESKALGTAQKIRAEIQTELDELANDVLVLSGPVDLCDKPDAIRHYREATALYVAISDEVPDIDELENADLKTLSELGARVAHARWQMDAVEAIIDGEPIPDKPQVAPPPEPQKPPPTAPAPRQQMPQRQPRPRVPYSRSPRRSGGGLLDILIAGAGMLGSSRRSGGSSGSGRTSGGGMFGRPSPRRSGPSRSGSSPGPRGGGVFGGGTKTRSGSRPSSRRSTSRSRSRKSTSRRRRR